MEKYKVSIITPVYNSEKYIRDTITCVLNQPYKNWEMYLVDDCSTDASAEIIKEMTGSDKRFIYHKLDVNSGAAAARNYAIRSCQGRFAAFLDADDLWQPAKLEKQVGFMLEQDIAFSCSDYDIIDDEGCPKNKIISIPKVVTYNLYLRNTIIQTVSVVVDISKAGKDLLNMPPLRRRQDAATWCQLLKNGFNCYGLNQTLASYRKAADSLSSNKFKAVKGTWFLLRHVERLSLPRACFCFVGYAFNAVRKRIYIKIFEKP
jgi:teichuronic acid biosynthesis glycosyltransferase TuaG